MKSVILVVSLMALLDRSAVQAALWGNLYVECSKIKPVSSNSTFQACATTSFTTPSPSMEEDGELVYIGGYRSEFKMTTGLKEGTDVDLLSDSARKKAYKNGITVQVALDDDNECTVTVNVKDKSSECKSCKHCGDQKFTVDCTNVANGRKTKCESAAGSSTPGKSKIFFPLTKTALYGTTTTTPTKSRNLRFKLPKHPQFPTGDGDRHIMQWKIKKPPAEKPFW